METAPAVGRCIGLAATAGDWKRPDRGRRFLRLLPAAPLFSINRRERAMDRESKREAEAWLLASGMVLVPLVGALAVVFSQILSTP